MSLAELPEWLEWWLISLLLLAWCGIALAVALVIAGAVSLRERAPRPARQEPARDEMTMLAQIDADSALGRALRERAARGVGDMANLILARVPAQRTPERGRRRVPCAPGKPCGLHHPTICIASACCDRYCPTADPEQAS